MDTQDGLGILEPTDSREVGRSNITCPFDNPEIETMPVHVAQMQKVKTPYLSPPIFAGDNIDVEKFLDQFEEVGKLNGWDPSLCCVIFRFPYKVGRNPSIRMQYWVTQT